MFRRMLVPLDGSARAERAIPVAARIGRASGGSLIVLRGVNAAFECWPSLVSEPTLTPSLIDAHLAEAQRYLADMTTSVEVDGITREQVVLFGPTVPSILSVAHSCHADLIALCSHGDTGLTRWEAVWGTETMGSVTEKVVRSAPIPVCVLRARGPVPAGPHPDAMRPLRALIALDGSPLAKAALEPAATLIAALSAPAQGVMYLVRVVQLTSPGGKEQDLDEGEGNEQLLHKAKRDLGSTVEQLREGLVAPAVADLKLPVTWSVAIAQDVAGAIVRVAENGEDAEGAGVFGGCNIIAMATHGYAGIERWALGSIRQRVLHATRLPLLIVRPPDMMDKSHMRWDEAALSAIQG